jgi:hypothetical protein
VGVRIVHAGADSVGLGDCKLLDACATTVIVKVECSQVRLEAAEPDAPPYGHVIAHPLRPPTVRQGARRAQRRRRQHGKGAAARAVRRATKEKCVLYLAYPTTPAP